MEIGNLEKVLRVGEGRRLKRLQEQAAYITSLEPDFEQLSAADLQGKTAEFRQRLENGESLDELVFEAFAAVREARKRASDQRMFDVQLMGGIVLHEGDIAEMKTGEGKTFVASLALYLNGLAGRGTHLVTVNDYLAQRDAEWNRPVFESLGMTVAYIETMMPFDQRKAAYDADITYGTNSEFGFDYLRDNMAVRLDGVVQRGHPFGIVDEVDSILIDEARTPLIISGEPETAAQLYYDFARVAKQLIPFRATPGDPKGAAEEAGADFEFDEKFKTVGVTPQGVAKVERAIRIDNLYAPENTQLVNHLYQSLKAESLYHLDIDYVIQDGEVKIVDEFTGRIMEGRRWSEGLHQAVEAKEGVKIQEEHQTLATITLQNYFRLYEKLAGMTGTAKTEEKEFVEIYNLDVVEIPTNVAVARADENDLVFKTKEGKFAAVVRDIEERAHKGQPVLVGTIAVETSEYLSQLLTRKGVKHNVLNAKEHAREAEIIKDAGQRGAVTIATNMAGRGVDIKLGDGVVDVGGLYVLGTERHESRRIDNQLRGRSGRQGDPGETRFYLSGRGRPRAPLRRRPDQGHHGPLQDPGGPAHGGEDPLPADRGRAEEGRGAELRHAQERPQVRRRPQPASWTDLRAAPAGARRRGPLRPGQALDRGGRRGHGQPVHAGRVRARSGISRRSRRRWPSSTGPRSRRRSYARTSARSPARR